jgi:hypothetical protein
MPPGNIKENLNYNEKKVQRRHAKLIHSSGYLKDTAQLNFQEKLQGFTRLIERNNSKTNALHISLNFSRTDQLNKEKLTQIADDYMERIGFGDQPYLVYQHDDAGHPHIHIVTTSIRADGSRINTYRIGADKSEKARKAIEILYGLTKAEDSKLKEALQFKSVDIEKVMYGKSETKRAITNVLNAVLEKYKFSSLPELNAILGLYNVQADRGKEDSRTYQKQGLFYRLLNEQGEKVGIPIKASLFYCKPTLKFLQIKFLKNSTEKETHKKKLANTIKLALLKKPDSLDQLIKDLETKGIHVIKRIAKTGMIYGLTYIDHNSKCVFNGRDVGTAYSAKAVLDMIEKSGQQGQQRPALKVQDTTLLPPPEKVNHQLESAEDTSSLLTRTENDSALENLIETLLAPEYTDPNLPYPLRPKRKKRKRK